MLVHDVIAPNYGDLARRLDDMSTTAETGRVAAFKVYTARGPDRQGPSWFSPRRVETTEIPRSATNSPAPTRHRRRTRPRRTTAPTRRATRPRPLRPLRLRSRPHRPGSPTSADDHPGTGDAFGIFDFETEANPFADWSAVFVPYCTGDVFLGDATASYGDLTVEHNGFTNASFGLDVLDTNEALVEAGGVDLDVYVAPGTEHTVLLRPSVYTLEVEGVAFIDWLTDFVETGDPGDVRCTDCGDPAVGS